MKEIELIKYSQEVWRLKEEILEELNIKEDNERECKLATGGLPESIWETYSSFANTMVARFCLELRNTEILLPSKG